MKGTHTQFWPTPSLTHVSQQADALRTFPEGPAQVQLQEHMVYQVIGENATKNSLQATPLLFQQHNK